MSQFAQFNDYGDCRFVMHAPEVPDGWVEVPEGTQASDIWRNPDTGEIVSREPSTLSFERAYSVGEAIDFTVPAGAITLVDGEKVKGAISFDAPGRHIVQVIGRHRLETIIEIRSYAEERKAAYPSIAEQLDKIYHEGVDAWRADIQAVKEQFPKPGE